MESLTPEQQALFAGGGQLSDYDVLKPIGKGKFSVVFKATRRRDAQAVALKKIAIFDLMDAKAREKTLKEVRLVQSVNHPNIIQYLDAFIENNELWIAFEWAEAGDLKRQVRKANEKGVRFDERTVWRYFAQLCAAMLHLHRARIMHRDLKPANIFLTLQGVVKLGDLGLGRHLSENTLEARSKVGTPLYMSPEVLRGEPYDWKSDVWSLGCILYELAVLRSPFKSEGLDLYGLFQKINKGEFEPVPPLYSDHLRQVVNRMLSLSPADRPTLEEVWSLCERRPSSAALQRSNVDRSSATPERAAADQNSDIGSEKRRPTSSNNAERSPQPPSRPSSSRSEKQQGSGSLSRPPSSAGDASATLVARPEGEIKAKRAEMRMELLFDKLSLANADKMISRRISRKHFLDTGESEGGSSFNDMIQIGRCLLARLGHNFSIQEHSVQPVAACQRLLLAAEQAGVPEVAHLSATALVSGCGEEVCELLDALCERVLRTEGVFSAKAIYPIEPIETVDGEDALEVAEDDAAQSADGPGDTTASTSLLGGDLFAQWLVVKHEVEDSEAEVHRQMIHSRIDPAAWKLEMQRTLPKLRQQLAEARSVRASLSLWETRVGHLRRMVDTVSDNSDSPRALASLQPDGEQLERLEKWLNDKYLKVRRHYHETSEALARAQQAAQSIQTRTSEAAMQLRDLQRAVEESEATVRAQDTRLTDNSELVALRRQLQRVSDESREFARRVAGLHDLMWRRQQVGLKRQQLPQF